MFNYSAAVFENMKRIFSHLNLCALFLALSFFFPNLIAQAQSSVDGTVVLQFDSVNPDDDYKYSIISKDDGDIYWDDKEKTIKLQNIINEGRYIVSAIQTDNSNIIVLHKRNTNSIKQICEAISMSDFKKTLAKRFKQGLPFKARSGYWDPIVIFEENPKITMQEFVIKTNMEKKIQKMNAKGKRIINVSKGIEFVVQSGFEGINQNFEYFSSKSRFLETVKKRASEGWIVGSMSTSLHYFTYNNSYRTTYDVIFEKQDNDQDSHDNNFVVVDIESELADAITNNATNGYYISKIGGQWENRDEIRKHQEEVMNQKTDWLGLLGGLVTTTTSLISGSSNGSSVSTLQGSTSYDSQTSKGSSSKGSSKGDSSKASYANWSSLDKSYSDYESQLIRMSNSSNINKQEVQQIQRKMKEIREKIKKQSGGHERAISQWETWIP